MHCNCAQPCQRTCCIVESSRNYQSAGHCLRQEFVERVVFGLSCVCSQFRLVGLPRTGWGLVGPPRTGWGPVGPPRTGWGQMGPPRTGWGLMGPPRTGWGLTGPPRTGWGPVGLRKAGATLSCDPRAPYPPCHKMQDQLALTSQSRLLPRHCHQHRHRHHHLSSPS